jgi:hypothetical protein
MAAKRSWTSKESVGHAFVYIRVSTKSGFEEDCFRFYSKEVDGAIGGPVTVLSEFVRKPTGFSRMMVSVTKAISPKQRRRLVQVFGLKRSSPAVHGSKLHRRHQTRPDTQLPEVYVRKLKDANL